MGTNAWETKRPRFVLVGKASYNANGSHLTYMHIDLFFPTRTKRGHFVSYVCTIAAYSSTESMSAPMAFHWPPSGRMRT